MNSERGFIQNIVAIAILLVIVFLSQQPQFRVAGKDLYAKGAQQGTTYWAKAETWFKNTVWPKVDGEVGKTKAVATQEFSKQKNNFLQGVWENIKNYFAQKFSKTFGTEVK